MWWIILGLFWSVALVVMGLLVLGVYRAAQAEEVVRARAFAQWQAAQGTSFPPASVSIWQRDDTGPAHEC